jgi:hypothetical protein
MHDSQEMVQVRKVSHMHKLPCKHASGVRQSPGRSVPDPNHASFEDDWLPDRFKQQTNPVYPTSKKRTKKRRNKKLNIHRPQKNNVHATDGGLREPNPPLEPQLLSERRKREDGKTQSSQSLYTDGSGEANADGVQAQEETVTDSDDDAFVRFYADVSGTSQSTEQVTSVRETLHACSDENLGKENMGPEKHVQGATPIGMPNVDATSSRVPPRPDVHHQERGQAKTTHKPSITKTRWVPKKTTATSTEAKSVGQERFIHVSEVEQNLLGCASNPNFGNAGTICSAPIPLIHMESMPQSTACLNYCGSCSTQAQHLHQKSVPRCVSVLGTEYWSKLSTLAR